MEEINLEKKILQRADEKDVVLEIIKNLEEYRENSKNGLVILINGPWGSGKTTFLEKLETEINEKKEFEIFSKYDSWEYDFYENAYLPFFSNIEEKLKLGVDLELLVSATSKVLTNQITPIVFNVVKSFFKNKTGIDFTEILSMKLNY